MTGRMPNVCAITGTPASGRSSMAANLAVLAAKQRQRVLLIDFDLLNPSQRLDFGLPVETAGVSAAVRLFALGRLDRDRFNKIAPPVSGTRERLRVLTGLTQEVQTALSPDAIAALLSFASQSFDRVFLDLPACNLLGFEAEMAVAVESMVRFSSNAILVADQSPTGVQRLISAARQLQAMNPPPLTVVINRVRASLHTPAEVGSATQKLAGFGVDFEVPYERFTFDRASSEGRPALLSARRGAIRAAYQRILESLAPQ